MVTMDHYIDKQTLDAYAGILGCEIDAIPKKVLAMHDEYFRRIKCIRSQVSISHATMVLVTILAELSPAPRKAPVKKKKVAENGEHL